MISSNASRHTPDPTALLFFVIAVSFKVPWTAISSLLGQFSKQFNRPAILLQLNLAYFLPSMPMLLLQSVIMDRLEQAMGAPKAAVLRYSIGLGGLAALALTLPAAAHSPGALLGVTAAVGVAYSIAFGTSYQLAARFPPNCTVALTTGFVSCGVVVLLVDLAIKRGPYYTPQQLVRLSQVVALQCLVGLAAAGLLLRLHWRKLAAAGKKELVALQLTSKLSRGGGLGSGNLAAGSSWAPAGVHTSSSGGSSSSSGGMYGSHVGLRPSATLQGTAGTATPGYTSSSSRHGSHGGWPSGLSGGAGMSSYPHTGAAAAAVIDVEAIAGSSSISSSGANRSQALTSSGDFDSKGKPLGRRARWQPLRRLMQRCRDASEEAAVLLPTFRAILPAATALLLSVGSSMLAFPFFTYVPLSGAFGEHLPQVLFYARLGGDIAGRLLPPRLQLSTKASVLSWGLAKAGLLLVLVPALLHPRLVGGDLGLTVLVTVNWWLSGYVNVGAYLVAPQCVAPTAKGRAGSLMALCFQCSCFAGLLGAWALQQSGLVHAAAVS